MIGLRDAPLTIVVGSGGVGKTTIAAAWGLRCAAAGHDTLVMTFDPSLRLKDTLGVGERARDAEAEVEAGTPGRLVASLLDARRTFDRLIDRYAPDEQAAQRIHTNRFYDHLCGSLAGVLEYMAVERLFEVSAQGTYSRIILDTPPTRQALDFLEAPQRLASFLESGALRIALKPWFDEQGHLRHSSRFGFIGRGIGRNVESFLDRIVGLEVLRDMAEFFQAFGPLYDGFHDRALEVQELLRADTTLFTLVSGPGPERVADTLFFARHLEEAGHRLGPIVVNRVHPPVPGSEAEVSLQAAAADGRQLLAWLSRHDLHGVEELRSLLGTSRQLLQLPLLAGEPTGLAGLHELGILIEEQLDLAAT